MDCVHSFHFVYRVCPSWDLSVCAAGLIHLPCPMCGRAGVCGHLFTRVVHRIWWECVVLTVEVLSLFERRVQHLKGILVVTWWIPLSSVLCVVEVYGLVYCAAPFFILYSFIEVLWFAFWCSACNCFILCLFTFVCADCFIFTALS